MKRLLLSSALVLALAAGGGVAYQAAADTNPPPGPPGMDHPPGPWAGGWGHGPGPGFHGPGGPGFGPRRDHDEKFSLFARVKDKNLSASDVKIIASAILLEHGNHDWTVTNVAVETDKSIDFSFATAHGDVIATFAVDPASGHIKRVS
jgi:hypothetical protein